jgi:hypothetical protein
VGETLLRRDSRDLLAWNESFLIGSGACAALLFPLTLLTPRHALDVELCLVALAVAVVVWRRVRRRAPQADKTPAPWAGDLPAITDDPVAVVLLGALFSIAAFFGILNLRSGNLWDSIQVWATKAQMLFVQGGFTREWFPEEGYDVRLLAYPPYISFFEAAFSRLRGGFDFDRLKPIFLCLYASLLLGTFAAARTLCSRRWALAAVLFVALLPELTTGFAAGGYVDMPLAAFVAAVVASSLRSDGRALGWRSPLPWLLGAMTTVKQEGMVLVVIACAAIGFSWILERPRRFVARLREQAATIAVIAAFVATRVTYVRWTGVHDITWGPFDAEHRIRALHSLRIDASLCLRILVSPSTWGLFWPAFFVAAAIAIARKQTRPTLVALAVAAAIGIDASVFLFTNWDIALHIEGAYARLLAQLAPAAAVVITAAAERIWSPASAPEIPAA